MPVNKNQSNSNCIFEENIQSREADEWLFLWYVCRDKQPDCPAQEVESTIHSENR